MQNKNIKTVVLCALFISLGIVLPFATGQIKQFGNMLLPMHLPVLLCGLVCGPWYGLATGFITPLLRSSMFAMPVMFPNAFAMAFELAAYGFVTGFIYFKSKKRISSVYIALISAMVSGRIIWGLVQIVIMGITENNFTLKIFVTSAVLNGIPGIIAQLLLIPMIMTMLKKSNIINIHK